MQLFGDNMPYFFFSVIILYEMHLLTFDLIVTLNLKFTLGTHPLVMFVIVQGTYLAWMPSINKKCHQKLLSWGLWQVDYDLPFWYKLNLFCFLVIYLFFTDTSWLYLVYDIRYFMMLTGCSV